MPDAAAENVERPPPEIVKYGGLKIAVDPDGNGTVVERSPPPWEKRWKPKTHGAFYLQELCPDWKGFKNPKQRAAFQKLEREITIERFEDIVKWAAGKQELGELTGDVADAVIADARKHPVKSPYEATPQRKELEDGNHDAAPTTSYLTPRCLAALKEAGEL